MTPPEALISVIAIIVAASDNDFSMIDKPPVSEKSTPDGATPPPRPHPVRLKKYGVARRGRAERASLQH